MAMKTGSGQRYALVFALFFGASFRAFAQTNPGQDDRDLARTVRAWASGGLGTGAFNGVGGGASARANGTVSIDRAVAMFRMTGSIEGIDGHTDHAEKSILGGIRFGGKNVYVIPAVGIGHARWVDDYCNAHAICTPNMAAQFEDEGRVIAYDLGVHATKFFAGLALNITGVAGSGKTNLLAMVISLELGAFGR
jgi:hypothetical protein